MKIYRNIKEIEQDQSLIGYVRPLRRVWDELKLSAVACINGIPTLYHADSAKILSSDELKEMHRLFWNQGIASVLLVVDPRSAYIFSGFVSPLDKDDDLSVHHSPLVCKEKYENSLQHFVESFYESVASGEFYRRYTEKFNSRASVDEYLTTNLRGLQSLLTQSKTLKHLSEEDAHNFICRLLFACYLVDRKIIALKATHHERLHEALAERGDSEAIDYLYRLFKSLKSQFNGSMFDQDLDAEKAQFTPAHMAQIKSFLRGDKVGNHQVSLGFWAYDFKMIPVETISGIYENFLGWEDKNLNGAYYTPRFLAEMVLDVATENNKNWTQLRYLDPCCGSGIFLVSLFNRLATAWEIKNQSKEKLNNYYEIKANALLEILRTQIRGMDKKSSACTLACFSLYVALLDSFDPADIKTYIEITQHRLPKLFLRKDARLNGEDFIPVIHEGDTLTSTRFDDYSFDMAIGNPPWVNRGKKQLALQFLNRLDTLLKNHGQACLLLPSALFLNTNTDAFQQELLQSHTLMRVIQLADFRFMLFPTAQSPCMIVHYQQGTSKNLNHNILYDTPKFNFFARRQGLIAITEVDRKAVPQGKMLWLAAQKKAHIYWKRMLWGTPRDQRLLEYLEQFPKLCDRAGDVRSDKPWRKGQGIIPDSMGTCLTPKSPWWKENDLFIDAKSNVLNSNVFLYRNDTEQIGNRFETLTRDRANNRLVFEPPLVLISQGFGKVVFCDFPVLYQDSLQGIHAPKQDEELLIFLTAYLRSDLAKYYCFHTSSKWGIERDVVRFEELLNLPFPLPEDAPNKNASQIIQKIVGLMKSEQQKLKRLEGTVTNEEWLDLRNESAEELQKKTNELIYEYFDISSVERWLIEDTIDIFEPSSTPTNADTINLPTLHPVNQSNTPNYCDGLTVYANALTSVLNSWAKELASELRLSARGCIDSDAGLVILTLQLGKKEESFRLESALTTSWNDLFNLFSNEQVTLKHERQLFCFKDTSLYIIRPISLLHWTRSAALNDADHIFAQIQIMEGALE